ncbi:MAG: ABC transporter permease [Deltaproteobacteria bacterium]|nr:ABC transporter permease [Deltaproteobacteria bacterium]
MRRVWSNLLAVAYKEAMVIRHDRPLLATMIVQPISFLVILGIAVSFTPRNVPWIVLDRSATTASRRLVQEIEASGYVLPAAPVTSYDDGVARLHEGSAVAFLVIDRDFARAAERGQPTVQVLLDGADPLTAARIGGVFAEIAAAHDPGGAARRPRPDAQLAKAGPLDVRQRFWFNPTLDDSSFFLSALAAMLLTQLCLSATALALVGERENGTYEQMLSLPTSAVEIVLGKLLPYAVLCYVQVLIALVPAGLLLGFWPRGSIVLLFVVTLPFVLASLGVGTFVSSLATTSAQAVFLSVFFIMPSFVLSGVMTPYQLMPDTVRNLGGILPLRWYQIASRRIIERGAGIADVAAPTLVLCAMFAAILGLLKWRMKPRLD